MSIIYEPFIQKDEWTKIHNFAIDHLMPILSANAWKALCLVARQTNGYQRSEHQMNYRELQAGTGIKSSATMAGAIKELLTWRCIVVSGGAGAWDKSTYAINATARYQLRNGKPVVVSALENEVEESSLSTLENEVGTALENEVAPTSKTKGIIRKKESFKEKKETPPPPPTEIAANASGGGGGASQEEPAETETEAYLRQTVGAKSKKARQALAHLPLAVVQQSWERWQRENPRAGPGAFIAVLKENPPGPDDPPPIAAERPQAPYLLPSWGEMSIDERETAHRAYDRQRNAWQQQHGGQR